MEGLEGLEDYGGRMDGRKSNTLELRELGGFFEAVQQKGLTEPVPSRCNGETIHAQL